MKMGKDSQLDTAVMKWYVQQKSSGMYIRGMEILAAASEFAEHLGVANFKGSDGWLWHFRKRHGLFDVKVHGEADSADSATVEPLRFQLNRLIESEGLALSQIYNADETGFYWCSLPKNTQERKKEETAKGKKMSKEHLSALCGANAIVIHRLKITVVGKAKKPRALQELNLERDLSVVYYHSKNAWFTSAIFLHWFHHVFVPGKSA